MGVQEIVDRLGYSRGYTSSLINAKGFPDPAYELAMGRIWLAKDVEAWIREHRPELAGGTAVEAD